MFLIGREREKGKGKADRVLSRPVSAQAHYYGIFTLAKSFLLTLSPVCFQTGGALQSCYLCTLICKSYVEFMSQKQIRYAVICGAIAFSDGRKSSNQKVPLQKLLSGHLPLVWQIHSARVLRHHSRPLSDAPAAGLDPSELHVQGGIS